MFIYHFYVTCMKAASYNLFCVHYQNTFQYIYVSVYLCFSDVLVSQPFYFFVSLLNSVLSHLFVAHVYYVLPPAAKPVCACVVVKVIPVM